MNSKFSAAGSALGYIYQIRYGLRMLVSNRNENDKLLIERIDDISINTLNGPEKLYQTKLHTTPIRNLTSSSVDFWKTMRVWSEGILNGSLNPSNCIFTLLTTETASQNSIPYLLKTNKDQRDINEIKEKLFEISTTSLGEANKEAYASYLALSDTQQEILIKNIVLVDASEDLNVAKDSIKKDLCYSTFPERIDALYERLEGWFLGEVVLQLQNIRNEITGEEVSKKILDITDSLKSDNLPDDFATSIVTDESQLTPYRGQMFVKQLELIGVNHQMINHAISDFHRAFSQKSRWLRDGLINPDEELSYDNKLEEDWSRKFAILGDLAVSTDDVKKTGGKSFYENHYSLNYPQIYIRDRFKEQYMILGSCQILSGKKRIGWHPDFKTLI